MTTILLLTDERKNKARFLLGCFGFSFYILLRLREKDTSPTAPLFSNMSLSAKLYGPSPGWRNDINHCAECEEFLMDFLFWGALTKDTITLMCQMMSTARRFRMR